jgi:hypothetical protein
MTRDRALEQHVVRPKGWGSPAVKEGYRHTLKEVNRGTQFSEAIAELTLREAGRIDAVVESFLRRKEDPIMN